MGSNISKSHTETDALAQKNDLDKDICINPDPRSPTPEITRTPLQNKNGVKHNITKNVDLRKTFENGTTEEKLINNNPILSAVIKNHLQSYDPRSPTQDFERTPIVLSSKIDDEVDEKLNRAQVENFGTPRLNNETMVNSNLDSSSDGNEIKPVLPVPKNLCEGFYNMTLHDTLNENEEPLGSSTASNEVIEKNMSHECTKPAQILETNFDYVEIENEKFEDSKEDMNDEDNDILECEIKNIPLYKILQEDPRSPSIGIERTPIVVSKIEDVSKENVEEMSDDSLMKALQTTHSEVHQTDVQDGILIYEDESDPVKTPKKSKSSSNSGSRTPLSCMKNKTDTAHGRSKSTNTLYDSKDQKVIKLQKRISHIPRLKSLTKQPRHFSSGSSHSLKSITTKTAAVSGDCENTPPHSHRDKWDNKDNSIVL